MPVLLIAILVLALFVYPKPVAYSSESEPASVLLVYDRLAAGTAKEGNVEAMLKLLSAMGTSVKLTPLEQYQTGMMRKCDRLIVIRNDPDHAIRNERFSNDSSSYSGAYLHLGDNPPALIESKLQLQLSMINARKISLSIGPIERADIAISDMRIPVAVHYTGEYYGTVEATELQQPAPFAVKNDKLAFVPFFEAGTAAEIAMAYVLEDWLEVNVDGEVYVLFKEIYPFTDLEALQTTADRLYESGIPFIYSVRPVFTNTDYPAMQRYLELLKYAQSRNGTILINAPVISSVAGNQEESLHDKMTGFIDLLADHEIVPIGIGADLDMFWRNEWDFMKESMSFFDSTVLYQGEGPVNVTQAESISFRSSMLSVRWRDLLPLLNTKWLVEELPLHVAITFDFPVDTLEADTILQGLQSSWITFSDYKTRPHQTETEYHELKSENGLLVKDGQAVSLTAAIGDVKSDHEYKEKQEQSLKWLFTVQNNFYLVVIGIALLLFSGLFAAGFRLYRRKFRK